MYVLSLRVKSEVYVMSTFTSTVVRNTLIFYRITKTTLFLLLIFIRRINKVFTEDTYVFGNVSNSVGPLHYLHSYQRKIRRFIGGGWWALQCTDPTPLQGPVVRYTLRDSRFFYKRKNSPLDTQVF